MDAIKKAVADLSKASHKLAEEVYAKMGKEQGQAGGGPAGSAGTGNGGEKPEEKVVEAEFEEVDKDKK